MAKKQAGPNAGSRKAAARKAGKCQLCGTKVANGKGKSVIVDPPGIGDVSIVKAREGKSFWCADCAKKKKGSYERAIEVKRSNGKGKSKPAAKKATGKGKARTKATGTRKRSTGKGKATGTRKATGTKKRGSGKTADPF